MTTISKFFKNPIFLISYVQHYLSHSHQLTRGPENESCFKERIPGVYKWSRAFRGKYGTMSGEGSATSPRVSGAGHVNMGLYYDDAPDNNLFGCDDIEPKGVADLKVYIRLTSVFTEYVFRTQ